jgi:hypothetical protein
LSHHTKDDRLGSTGTFSGDRSELFNEIRRITSILEFGRRDMCRNTTSPLMDTPMLMGSDRQYLPKVHHQQNGRSSPNPPVSLG